MIYLASLSEAIHTFVDQIFSVSWITIFTHITVSIVVVFVIGKFFSKPTNKFIEKHKNRLNTIHRDLTISNNETQRYLKLLKEESDELITIKETNIKKIKLESDSIIKNSKAKAQHEAEIILDLANKEAVEIAKEAKQTAHNKVVQLSIELTEKLVKKHIDAEHNKKMIDTYLEQLESKKTPDSFK